MCARGMSDLLNIAPTDSHLVCAPRSTLFSTVTNNTLNNNVPVMPLKEQEFWANLFYFIREGYPHHAIEYAEKEQKKYSTDPLVKLHLAIALGNEGKLQDCIKHFSEIKENEEYALSCYVSLVTMSKRCKNYDSVAVKQYEAKIREIRRQASDMSLYYTALCLFLCQKYEKARDYCEKALKANLLCREILSLNGWIDLMSKDENLQKKAIRYFEDPSNDEEALNLQCLMGKAKYFQLCNSMTSALDKINIAVVHFPTFLPALIEKMKLQLGAQDWEQAMDTSQRCLSIERTCVDAIIFQLLYLLCKTGDRNEGKRKVDELASSLDTSEPFSAEIYARTSRLFSTLCGREQTILQKLCKLAEKALSLAPTDSRYAVNMGRILVLQDRSKEAIRHFQMTLETSDSSVTGLQGIIQCQLVQGMLSEAGTQLEFLRELEPTIGKSAELSFLSAVLARKQGAPKQQVVNLLDEAFELHSKRCQNLQLGFDYFEALNVDFIVQLVKEYLYQAPQQPPASMWLPGACRRQDDPVLRRCLKVLEPVISAAPGIQITAYLQAYTQYLLGDALAALSSVKACLELDETWVEGHILLAQIYLYQANLKLAERALETGLSNNFEVRDHPLYQLVRARLLIRQGSAKVAVQILKQTIASLSGLDSSTAGGRQTTTKRSSVQETSSSGGKNLSASERLTLYLELAEAHRSLSEWHEATKVLQDAQLAFSGTSELGRVTIASAELVLAQGDHEAALTSLRSVRPENAYYVQARQHMANIYLQHRKEKKLYAACYRELAEKLDTTESHLLLGDAYMTIQEPERAIEVYESVLRKNPSDLRLATKMGEALVQTHHYAKAVSYYEAAVKDGQSPLLLDLIDLLIKLKQFEKARRLITPLVTQSTVDATSSGIFELKEIRRAIRSLINLCSADHEKSQDNIDLLKRAKATQARRLARVQTVEAGEVVTEQRLAMAEEMIELRPVVYRLNLKLAKLHAAEIRHLLVDRHAGSRDHWDRDQEEKLDTSRRTGQSVQSANEHQTNAIDALKEAITQVTAVAGRGTVDTRRPGTIGLLRAIGAGELSRTRREAVRLEAEALVQLASLYLTIGDLSNCEQETLKLAQLEEELEANQRPSALTSSRETEASGQPKTAEEKCKSNVDSMGDHVEILTGVRPAASIMAELMYAKNDFDAAAKHLESIVAKHPTDYVTLSRLIDALRRSGNLLKIPIVLDKAKLADPMGDSAPGYNFCRGLYHRITGESSLALKCFNQSRVDCDLNEESIYYMVEICLNPDNQLPSDDAEDGLNEGTTSVPNSNGLRHVSCFTPNGPANQTENGRTTRTGLQTAEQLLKEIPKPTNARRHQYLSNMLLLMSASKPHVTSALENFAQMAQDEPDSGALIYGAAACYVVLKQTQKARNQLKRLAKVPWNVQDAEELEKAWLLLADIYIQGGKTDLSQDLLKRCLQYNKCCTKAYEYSGYIMEREQNFAEAVRNYELAWINSNKKNLAIGYKLAYNHLKVRQILEAIEVCLHVLEVQPNYPKIRKDILEKARMSLRT
ncbi:Tetratricopeptide repeat protein 21B [Fasciola hepatica]|uniref:Tetratricopeptide repeat protein 21B n=1 Tax=Fasciola hepatica TaxID=6192 RepID=A0A4E0RKF5_FASHE|nr:Tetratricopeptide repeat protein 21B [Fasciola hepatica]